MAWEGTAVSDEQKPDRTGREFEAQVERLLRLTGFKVERNVIVGGTQMDLVAKRDDPMAPVLHLVECTEKSRPVGLEYVKEKAASLLDLQIDGGVVFLTIVSRGGFSAEAKDFASARSSLLLRTIGDLESNLIQFAPYRDGYLFNYENSTGIFEEAQLYDYYVEPNATTAESAEEVAIEPLVRDWLTDDENNVLFILGDYGAGKTSFLRHFTYNLLSSSENGGTDTGPVPILIPLREYREALNVRQVITDTLLNEYGVRLSSFQTFEHFCSLGRALLLLDGFDEMAARSDQASLFDCLSQIFILAQMNVKVVVTCRANFFRSHYQLLELLREFVIELPKHGSPGVDTRPLGRHGGIVTIMPLTPSQIRSFIERRLPGEVDAYLDKIAAIHDLSDLCTRPVLLDMILSTLPSFDPNEVINSAALYEHYTDRWVRKDQWRVSMSRKVRHAFCDVMAWTMLARGMTEISHGKLRELIAVVLGDEPVDEELLEKYANDLQTCSFLARSGPGEGYEFAHKSFKEYFAARRIASALTEGAELPEETDEAPFSSPWSRENESLVFPGSLSSAYSLRSFRYLLDWRLEKAGAWTAFDKVGSESVLGRSGGSLGSQLEHRVTSMFGVEDSSMARSRLPFDLTPEIATFALEWFQMKEVSFDLLVEKAAGPAELKTLVELIKHGTAPDFFAANEQAFMKYLRHSEDAQFTAALAGALVAAGYIKSKGIVSAMHDALAPRAFHYVAYVIAEDGDAHAMSALAEYASTAEMDTLTSLIVTFGQRASLPARVYNEKVVESIRTLAADGEDPELIVALADSISNDIEDLFDMVEAILHERCPEETQLKAVKLLEGVSHVRAERRLRRMWMRPEVGDRPRKALQRLEERVRSLAATEQDRKRWSGGRGKQVRDSLWRSLDS